MAQSSATGSQKQGAREQELKKRQQQQQMNQFSNYRQASMYGGYAYEEYDDEEDEDEEWVRLDEDNEDEYEPTEEDVLEYARFLGMDPVKDKKYLYIAKEGLKAPLPSQWHPYQNKYDDQVYYVNSETGEKQLEHPCDEYYAQQFEETKIKDRMKQAEQQIRQHQEKQDMNEGFVGGSRVLDTSMNQSDGESNFLANQDLYGAYDELAEEKGEVEMEILEELEKYEETKMQEFRKKSIDQEAIRKKKQREIEGDIEKEMSDLKKQIKEAEGEKLKRKEFLKKDKKTEVQEEEEKEFNKRVQGFQVRDGENKAQIKSMEESTMNNQAEQYEGDLKEVFNKKNKSMQGLKDKRAEKQRQFEDKNKVARQRNEAKYKIYKEKTENEMDSKLRELERDEEKHVQQEQERILAEQRREYETQKKSSDQTIEKAKSWLRNNTSKIRKTVDENATEAEHKIHKKFRDKMTALENQNAIGVNDHQITSELEGKRSETITRLETNIESERIRIETELESRIINLSRDISNKYELLLSTLKGEGNSKLVAIREEFASRTNMNDKDLELIFQKQSLILQLDRVKEELQEANNLSNKSNKYLLKLQSECNSINEELALSVPATKKSTYRLNTQEGEIQKKLMKLQQNLDSKEELILKLDAQKDGKKKDIFDHKKKSLEYQKDLLLTREKNRLQKKQNLSSTLKYEELVHEIASLKQTLQPPLLIMNSADVPAKQTIVHEEPIVKKSQVHQQNPQNGDLDFKNISSIPQNPMRQKRKKNIQKKPQIKSVQESISYLRRKWSNILIEERNKLLEIKIQIAKKADIIKGMQGLIQNEKFRLKQQISRDVSEIKKNAFQNAKKHILEQIEKLNEDVKSQREAEVLLALKDKSLSNMENLLESEGIEGAEESTFNEQTFVELHRVYCELELPKNSAVFGDFTTESDTLQASAWGQINGNFSRTSLQNPSVVIQEERNVGDVVVADATTVSVLQNNYSTVVRGGAGVGRTTIAGVIPSTVGNYTNGFQSALQSLKQRHDIPNRTPTEFIDSRVTSHSQDPLLNQIKKRFEKEKMNDFVSYNNWMNSIKTELNSKLIDGHYQTIAFKTIS